ncbi:mitochondrial 54S ribosomal protein YmL19 [Entomophthora muscae]|uniref:Mitochondrial 54S ribosomal protein YmL19 n=1 Tax=Entomophthora muscae TaxID=34485 RepID=A0ACC2RME3_9FUNG|nr:mitochondrial 54S ribosomal protein YmL19 [Entomophthora muscae]
MASRLKLIVPAAKATPSPPIGPALGQRGIKSMDFCKQFNDRTKDFEQGVPIPVVITIKPDRTFTFINKTPPTSFLLKRAAGIEKGSSQAGHDLVGEVSLKHIYEIAVVKQRDEAMANLSLRNICSAIIGSAKSAGIKVVH